MPDTIEDKLIAAYVRGVEWRNENPSHTDYPFRFKAARDYADKILGEPSRPSYEKTSKFISDREAKRTVIGNTEKKEF